MENEMIIPESNGESPIAEVETYLIDKFVRETTSQDIERGYLSVEFVNQIIQSEPKIAAAKLIIQQLKDQELLKDIDYIVEIPKFGTYLSGTINDITGIPIAPVRKDNKLPGQWKNTIILEEEIPSFTTGIPSKYIINGLNAGDRVLLVDDFLANGDTLLHFIKELREKGVSIVAAASYVIKHFQPGFQRIIEETGITPIGAIGIDEITPDGKIIPSKPIYATNYNPTPTP